MEAFGKPELGRADAIKKIAPYIRDGEPFRLGMLEDCSNYFKENGYEVMEPCLEMENSKVKK